MLISDYALCAPLFRLRSALFVLRSPFYAHMHTCLPSVEALVSAESLGELIGAPVTDVRRTALTPEFAKSGSRIDRLDLELAGGESRRLILKRVAPERDWLMRATDDAGCRSVALWERGVLDRLPAQIDHATLACARDGAGAAILMRDVGDAMLTNRPIGPAINRATLAAMAAMHAGFMGDASLAEPGLGLCRLEHTYTMFAPQVARRELAGGAELPPLILEGWERLAELIDPGLARDVLALVAEPAPLCAALRRFPQTLVHGDWRHANQAMASGPAGAPLVVLLDWQLATLGPPAVELGRYLGANSALLPGSKEETLAAYQSFLADLLGPRLDDGWWRPQLDLAMLGGLVQDGWAIALKATTWKVGADARDHWRADLSWWAARAREGMRHL